MVSFKEDIDGREKIRLIEEANEILRQADLDIWGRKRTSDNYVQNRFESNIRTGAYSRNGEKSRKGRNYN